MASLEVVRLAMRNGPGDTEAWRNSFNDTVCRVAAEVFAVAFTCEETLNYLRTEPNRLRRANMTA